MPAVVIPLLPRDVRHAVAVFRGIRSGPMEKRLALSIVLQSLGTKTPSWAEMVVEQVALAIDDDLAKGLERLVVTRSAPAAAVEFSARVLLRSARAMPEAVILAIVERCPAIDEGIVIKARGPKADQRLVRLIQDGLPER